MSVTYEANLNCDGKDCKTQTVTLELWTDPKVAKYFLLEKAKKQDWVIIEDEHYCPDCAETTKRGYSVF